MRTSSAERRRFSLAAQWSLLDVSAAWLDYGVTILRTCGLNDVSAKLRGSKRCSAAGSERHIRRPMHVAP
eukprot:6193492-Pleurochrysis_carterae.AAC.1